MSLPGTFRTAPTGMRKRGMDTIAVDQRTGIYLIDKPAGITSFKVVQLVRRALDIKKVGHAGTLDPFATGLLIVCAGRSATRLIPRLMKGDKSYLADLRLGTETDTQDLDGKTVAEHPVPELKSAMVERCLSSFIGQRMQSPPAYSALKYKGKPLYYYARRGIPVVKEPRAIEIKHLECLELQEKTITFQVTCSKGTYIRALAADIGAALGCGGHLTSLRRLRSGVFSVENSLPGKELHDKEAGRRLLLENRLSVEKIQDAIT